MWGAGKTYMQLTTMTNDTPILNDAPAVAVASDHQSAKSVSAAPFYIPSLDGIRAVAVAIVFFAHAGYDNLIPGGLGVTIFFFLSGYLITTLLRRELAKKGKISLRKFYLRRVLRIWPPMYLALALAVLLCWTGLIAVKRIDPYPLLFQSLHLTNIYTFVGAGKLIPGTSVLWSLCVEEHFYLIFPLLFVIMSRFCSMRAIAATLGVLCIAALAWRYVLLYQFDASPFRIFSGTDSRVDSILFGCIMALGFNPMLDGARLQSMWLKLALLSGGLILLAFTLLYRDDVFRSTWRYTLQGIALFPVFFLAVSESRWSIFRWLELSPLRALGKISYTLYLVHFPIIYVMYELFPGSSQWMIVASAAITSLIMATLVYYAVEKPLAYFRHLLA